MEYPALFEPAREGGFVVTFPDFDWGISQGDTEPEAREMAADAIRTMIQEHIREGEAIPRPSKPRGRKYRMIHMAALDAGPESLLDNASVFLAAHPSEHSLRAIGKNVSAGPAAWANTDLQPRRSPGHSLQLG